jgi:hypothetical protein
MGILGPAVQTFVGSVLDVWHNLPPGCSIERNGVVTLLAA